MRLGENAGRHSTRRDTKYCQAKGLTDQPKTGGEGDKPEIEKPGFSLITPAPTLTTCPPTPTSENQAQEPSPKTHYRQNIMRLFVAGWRRFCRFLAFCDEHDGAITALATVAIVALTTFYVCYSKKQWEALLESNKINRESARIDQRAWLTMSKFALEEDPSDSETTPIKVDFLMINTGKTPAIKCVVEKIPRLWRAPPTDDPWPNGPVTQKNPVFVLMPVAERNYTEPWPLPAENISLYTKQGYRLYVQVKIWYDDVFGGHHWATTCRWHEAKMARDDFRFCPTGTEIDNPEQQSGASVPARPSGTSSPPSGLSGPSGPSGPNR